MMYLLFIDTDSDSVRKLADLIKDKLLNYPEMDYKVTVIQ
jgi:hypothetical protein